MGDDRLKNGLWLLLVKWAKQYEALREKEAGHVKRAEVSLAFYTGGAGTGLEIGITDIYALLNEQGIKLPTEVKVQ